MSRKMIIYIELYNSIQEISKSYKSSGLDPGIMFIVYFMEQIQIDLKNPQHFSSLKIF